MATRRAKASPARPWWDPEKLSAHNKKHGKEVAQVRQRSISGWTTADYEDSSRSTISSAFYSIELKHVADDSRESPSGYSTDSFGLLSIRDTKTNRIRTHFPIGAFGETDSKWLGKLPRPFRELYALRSIYHRVRCGLYISKNRRPAEMLEKYLTSNTKKEIECCSLLKQKELHGITLEAANWMKLCFVCDWQDARHYVADASMKSRADELVSEFMRDTELKIHANHALNTICADIVRSRLVHSEQGDFLQLLNENSWTFTEAFLRLGPAVTYLELICEHIDNAMKSRAIVVKQFRDSLYSTAIRPCSFQKEVICFLTTWTSSVKKSEQTPLLGCVHSLIEQPEI
jgi:hypothetical protein